MQIVELDYTPLGVNIPVSVFVSDLYMTVSAAHGQCCVLKHSSLVWPVALCILNCEIISYYTCSMACIKAK